MRNYNSLVLTLSFAFTLMLSFIDSKVLFAQCLSNQIHFPAHLIAQIYIDGINWKEISTCNFNTEYATIQTMGGVPHEVESNEPSTFITISLDNGLTSFASGTGNVVFTPPNSGVARVYFNANNACATLPPGCHTTRYKIGTPNNCLLPNNLIISNIDTASANISWTAPTSIPYSGYEYYITSTHEVPAANTTPTGFSSTTNAVLNGLTMGVKYKIWMRSKCSNTSYGYWNVLDSFTTAYLQPRPWLEEFNAGLLPIGFLGSNNWTVDFVVDSFEGNPGNALFGKLDSGLTSQLTTTTINGILSNDILSFDNKFLERNNGVISSAPSNAAYFKLFLSTDFGNSFTQIDSINAQNMSGWAYKEYALAGYSSQAVKLKIEGFSNSNNITIALDNFYIGAAPECRKPLNGLISDITHNSANIAWSALTPSLNDGYEYYYSNSFNPPNSTTIASGSVASGITNASLNGLNSGTKYHVWARSICTASSPSAWTAIGIFETQHLANRPWIEHFLTSNLPSGFIVHPINNWETNPAVNSFPPLNTWHAEASSIPNTVTTINVDGILTDDILRFDYRYFDLSIPFPPYNPPPVNSGYFKVFISTDYGLTYTHIGTEYNNTINAWTEKNYDLSAFAGQIVRVKIESYANLDQIRAIFDNFYIGENCEMPKASSIIIIGTSPNYYFTAIGVENVENFTWNFGDNSATDTGLNVGHNYTSDGAYNVSLTIDNECGSDMLTRQVYVSGTNVKQVQLNDKDLKIYPNPAKDILTVENLSHLKMQSVRILNIQGQQLLLQKVKNGMIEKIDVSKLPNGIYTIQVAYTEGKIIRKIDLIK